MMKNRNNGLSGRLIDTITNFLGSPLSITLHLIAVASWFLLNLDSQVLIFILGLEGAFIWLFVIHTTNKIRDFEWKRERWERRRDRDKLEADIDITQKDLKVTQEIYKTLQSVAQDVEDIKARLVHESAQRNP
jgi:uncharacterized membrane protein